MQATVVFDVCYCDVVYRRLFSFILQFMVHPPPFRERANSSRRVLCVLMVLLGERRGLLVGSTYLVITNVCTVCGAVLVNEE